MIIRGIYTIEQTDRILLDEEIFLKAQSEITRQITEAVAEQMAPSIVKEAESIKYPYGRYILDLNVEVIQ